MLACDDAIYTSYNIVSPQRKYCCTNSHCMHHGCMNKFGAERQRHAINHQLPFKVLCPLCQSDETDRLVIEYSALSHLTDTKDTEEHSVERTAADDEEEQTENDSSYNLNPDEVIALDGQRITCFCCKLLIPEDHAYQACACCDRKLHSGSCFETECSSVRTLNLAGVCNGKPYLTYLI